MDFASNEDTDYALALRLQQEFDNDTAITGGGSQTTDDNVNYSSQSSSNSLVRYDTSQAPNGSKDNDDPSTWSLVDQRWEIIDPLPDVRALFLQFNDKYFWGRLAGIEVRWSPRMTLCAGLCVYEGRAGYCSVRLSEPLLKLRPRKDFIETLLHEMIHAYLFVTDNNRDHDGHGPEFHKHMYRLNKETGTNISVYHNFHDEVANYRQHWWKCDGPCQKKPPYHGLVKRAMNRAPSPRDPWWGEHQRSCGGTYTKIKQPEGYKSKEDKMMEKEKRLEEKEKRTEKKVIDKNKGNQDIRAVMGKNKSGNNDVKPSTSQNKQPTSDNNTGKKSETGVRENVHGFKNEKSGSINNFHGNMHGFGKLSNDEKSNDAEAGTSKGSGMTNGVSGYFPGQGKSLGASAAGSNGPIVRKIPGIGIITTERLSDQPSQEEAPSTSSMDTAAKPNIINYLSEDSDFDMNIDEILKKGAKKLKKSSILKKSNSFTSVSNTRRHSDPDRWKKADRMPIKPPGSVEAKPSFKRKSSDSLAADRNKRVCYISSSESDDDEKVTLSAMVKKRTPDTHNSSSEHMTDKGAVGGSSTSHKSPQPHSSNRFPAMSPPPPAANHMPSPMKSPPPPQANVVQVFRDCPVCCKKIAESKINDHLDLCLAGLA